MDFTFSDEQAMLRDTARRFLSEKAPVESARALMDTDTGFDEAVWAEIAAQGWQAMAIPEEYGGAGFSFAETGILMEEMGRVLFASPYLSSVVLGAEFVLAAGSPEQCAELLPDVAAGERRLALAHLEADGAWEPEAITMEARPDGDGFVLDGTKRFVIDGHTADTLLVVARAPGSSGGDGIGVFVVPAAADGVERTRVETLDQTRKQAEVRLASVRVPQSARLGDDGAGGAALDRVLRRAAIALAYEQVGGAERCLEMSVEYAKERIQFGRPIGSFQAVKHMCADMLVAVESAKSAAYYAGWAASTGSDDVPIAAAVAASYCSEAYSLCAGENIQIHGGLGFTWEHDAHLYFKRARSSELMFGTPAEHRARLATELGV